jgi:6,7-dimethyl-8-ribityllumazine synthase
MPTKLEGDLLAREARVAVVVTRFNDFITGKLLEGAVDAYARQGGNADKLVVAHVPGSFEIPVTALKLAKSGKFDAVVCLGCVIRGGTDHYEYIAQAATRGIAEAATASGVPVILGVITADNLEQAIERAGTKQGNHGAKAMLAAIEMVNLFKKI